MTTDAMMGWEDTIQDNSNSFKVLPAGTYRFEVVKVEKGTSTFTDTKGASMAKLTLKLFDESSGNTGFAQKLMVLHQSEVYKLCKFFISIGHMKSGEKLKMNWPGVVGATGLCEVSVKEFTKRDGTTGQSNEVKKFLDVPGAKEETPF